MFDQNWICKYPRPKFVITDQGSNFLGNEFEELLKSFEISHMYTTSCNPQYNSICERSHGFVNEHLRTKGLTNWHLHLPAISWIMRSSYHSSIGTTPGNAVFGMDMVLPSLPITKKNVDNKKLKLYNLNQENANRIDHKYNVGNLVLLKNPIKKTKFSK
eukprot:NODE_192_length_13323_cov_0.206216.p1 type:complete len:159 gc:universal NODE_192_length_13323_cov_0.206216:8094-7618(-)